MSASSIGSVRLPARSLLGRLSAVGGSSTPYRPSVVCNPFEYSRWPSLIAGGTAASSVANANSNSALSINNNCPVSLTLNGSNNSTVPPQSRSFHTSSPLLGGHKRPIQKRIQYPWQAELREENWKYLHNQMIEHFRVNKASSVDTTVKIKALKWPKYFSKEMIMEQGRIPAMISRYGPARPIAFKPEDLQLLAFDEEQGHLSHLFQGRLFEVEIEDPDSPGGNVVEQCYVSDVNCHVVDKELYFVRLERHVPWRYVTTVPIPVVLTCMFGCKAQVQGAHIELAMPTVKCEIIGDKFPPPLMVDCSKLTVNSHGRYGAICLSHITHLLEPFNGTVRFSREYADWDRTEIVMAYHLRNWAPQPVPKDYDDPNFYHRQGKYHLTYEGYWPKQTKLK